MLVALSPKRLLKGLTACIAVLASLHLLVAVVGLPGEGAEQDFLRSAFDLNKEQNVPTVYSCLQIALAVVFLLLLFRESRAASRPDSWFWLALAGVFTFLMIDEYFQLHEPWSWRVRSWVESGRLPLFAWVIPYTVLVAFFTLFFAGFWWRLPRGIRTLMAVSAALYVGGGIGLELVGSRLYEAVGPTSAWYALQTLVEETLELAGVALFIYVLARLLVERAGAVTLRLDPEAPA